MAVYEYLATISGAFQQAYLQSSIQRAEHILHTFCQPAFLRYHNAHERIGQVHQLGSNFFTSRPTHLRYSCGETVIDLPLIEGRSLGHRLDLFTYLASPFFMFQSFHQNLTPSTAACAQLRACFEAILRHEDVEFLHACARHINIINPPLTTWAPNGDLETYWLGHYRSACPLNLFQVFADGEEPRGYGTGHWIRERSDIPRWNPVAIGQNREQQAVITDIDPTAEPETVNIVCLCGNTYEGTPAELTVEPRCPDCTDRIGQITRNRIGQQLTEMTASSLDMGEQMPSYKYPDDPPRDSDTDAFIAEINALMEEEDTELPPEGTLPKSAPTG